MIREFKQFIAQGNVLGLAVAVVIGAAFGAVIASFSRDILMQLIAAIGAKPNFSQLSFTVNGSPIRYGAFLDTLVTFLIVAFAMFWVAKLYNRFTRKQLGTPESEKELLRQIRDALVSRRETHA